MKTELQGHKDHKDLKGTKVLKVFKVNVVKTELKVYQAAMDEMALKVVTDEMAAMEKTY